MRRLLFVVPRTTDSVLLQKAVLHDRLLPGMFGRATAHGRDWNVKAVHQGAKRCGSKYVISPNGLASRQPAAALRNSNKWSISLRKPHTHTNTYQTRWRRLASRNLCAKVLNKNQQQQPEQLNHRIQNKHSGRKEAARKFIDKNSAIVK